MERKFIDFHTHAFPDKIAAKTISFLSQKGGIPPYSDGSVGGLVRVLSEAGVAMGIVLPVVTKPEQFASITRFAAQINESYGGTAGAAEKTEPDTKSADGGNQIRTRMLSFGGIHPDSADYKGELKQLAEAGFRGVKLHPDYQEVYFDDIRFQRIMEYATELGLVIVTHAGLDVGIPEPIRCTPKRVLNVLHSVQPKKLVLAHMGGYELFDEVLESLAGEDVYFDTAFCLDKKEPDFWVKMCRAHGTDKILYATDCPWGSPAQFVTCFEELSLTEREKEQIAYENAERLLSLA